MLTRLKQLLCRHQWEGRPVVHGEFGEFYLELRCSQCEKQRRVDDLLKAKNLGPSTKRSP